MRAGRRSTPASHRRRGALADRAAEGLLYQALRDVRRDAGSVDLLDDRARGFAGTETAYRLAKKYNIKTVFGSDVLFDPGAASRQGNYLAMLS